MTKDTPMTETKDGAEAMSGWQPIATAPRDGTPVLIKHANWSIGPQRGYWHAPTEWWRIGGAEDWFGCGIWPSHWMPLPDAPTIRENGRAAPSNPTTES